MDAEDRLDKYKRFIANVDDGINLLLQNKSIDNVIFEDSNDVALYNDSVKQVIEGNKLTTEDSDEYSSEEEFHKAKSNEWIIPKKYQSIDIIQLLYDRCTSEEEIDRVTEELALYNDRKLLPLLRFLLYLVDYLRENKYVWGAGRGSSVASYVLYLLGVHKIDSIKYELCITEFLR